MRMADPLRDWDETTRMQVITESLKEEWQKFVDLRNPSNLTELRETIHRADSYTESSSNTRIERELAELKDLVRSVIGSNATQRNVSFESSTYARPTVKTVSCYNCHQEGHISSDCRAPCGYCEKLGHISRDCPIIWWSVSAAVRYDMIARRGAGDNNVVKIYIISIWLHCHE